MEKMEELKSYYDNSFSFRVEDKDNISVLCGGYAITPEGKFVNVLDNEDHSSVFSSYLREYMEDAYRKEEDSLHAMISLTELNHIVYAGVKLGDHVMDGNASQGIALLLFPKDLNVLTDEQKEACLALLATNKSIFGNYKKVELQIHSFPSTDYVEEDLVAKFLEELGKSGKHI